MKRVFSFFLVMILCMGGVFSFDLKDSSNVSREYFSSSNSLVYILTLENVSNFTINYNITTPITKEINLSYCDELNLSYCNSFNLVNLVNEQTSDTLSFTSFEVIVGSQSKVIYLDTQNPVSLFLNNSVDSETKKLTLNFNFSDNSNKFKSVELFEKVNSNYVLISEVSSVNSYNLDIVSAGTKVFKLKVIDLAGNLYEIEQSVILPDLFIPEVVNYNITRNNDKVVLGFKIKDDVKLLKYEIVQGGLILTENLNVQNYEKIINLPFTSGIVNFNVIDSNLNSVNLSLNLDSKINFKQSAKYTNKKIFEFESNANKCYLTKFDSKTLNTEFQKDSNKFSIPISVEQVKDYEVEFYCVLNNYQEYFVSNIYYDINSPSEVVINATKENEGFIELDWFGAEDKESEVIFSLYQDSKVIYTGKKSSYLDKSAQYPNEYEYYVEAVDEAGNKVKSDKIFIIPKKVKVTLLINLKQELNLNDPKFILDITTDINSNVSIFIRNNKTIVFEDNFATINITQIKKEILFEEGVNEVSLSITDEIGNILKQTYYVTYTIPITSKIVEEEVVSEKSSNTYKLTIAENITDILVPETMQEFAQNTVQGISSIFKQNPVEQIDEEKSFFTLSKFLFVLIFIIFAVLIWQFLFYEDKLRQKFKDFLHSRENKDKVNFRNKEKALNSNLRKIKEEREYKQMKILEKEIQEKKEKKPVREFNEYQKQKISDISKKDKISDRIISEENIRPQKEEKKVFKSESDFIEEEQLIELDKQKELKSKSGFFSWFEKDVEAEKRKHDPMLNYVEKVQHTKSYNSKEEYKYKEVKDLEESKVSSTVSSKNAETIYNQTLNGNNQKNKSLEILNKENKVEEKVEERKEVVKEATVDKKHLLDDYLKKVIPKRKSFFAEKEVQKDMFERK